MSRRLTASNHYMITAAAYPWPQTGSISFWHYPEYAYNDGAIHVLASIGPMATPPCWSMQKYSDGKWYIGWQKSGDDQRMVVSVGTWYVINTWHLNTLAWTPSGYQKWWVDGVERGSRASLTANSDLSARQLQIGVQASYANDYTARYAHAIVWNEALTLEEHVAMYRGTHPVRVRPCAIIDYWRFKTRDNGSSGYEIGEFGGGRQLNTSYGNWSSDPPVGSYWLTNRGLRNIESLGTVCWGHDTGVIEANIRDFNANWSGSGYIAGAGDAEKLYFELGEYMESETWNIGARRIKILIDKYGAGAGAPTLQYKDGATQVACDADSWHNYVGPYISSGWVKVRVNT